MDGVDKKNMSAKNSDSFWFNNAINNSSSSNFYSSRY